MCAFCNLLPNSCTFTVFVNTVMYCTVMKPWSFVQCNGMNVIVYSRVVSDQQWTQVITTVTSWVNSWRQPASAFLQCCFVEHLTVLSIRTARWRNVLLCICSHLISTLSIECLYFMNRWWIWRVTYVWHLYWYCSHLATSKTLHEHNIHISTVFRGRIRLHWMVCQMLLA